ncbi:hypothetical protein [Brachybacterium nesterenkovii]
MEPMPVVPDILTARFEDEAILRLRNYWLFPVRGDGERRVADVERLVALL